MFSADMFAPAETLHAICFAMIDVAVSMPELLAGLLAQAKPAVEPELTVFQRFLNNPLILPIGLFILFFYIFILPERRRKSEEAKMMSALKKNDRIVTVGGIHGTVVSTAQDTGVVTIRIDENSNTRIKVNRTAIASILGDGKENKDTSSKEPASDAKDK